jgi:hypothetical protein
VVRGGGGGQVGGTQSHDTAGTREGGRERERERETEREWVSTGSLSAEPVATAPAAGSSSAPPLRPAGCASDTFRRRSEQSTSRLVD